MSKFNWDKVQNILKNEYVTSEELTFTDMAIDSGHIRYAASELVDVISDDYPELSNWIKIQLKKYSEKDRENDLNEITKNMKYAVCKRTNQHYFLSNNFVDYFVDLDPEMYDFFTV